MPELPEVETVRRTLAPHVTDRAVAAIEWLDPHAARYPAEAARFSRRVVGRRVLAVERRGKYLRLRLGGGGEWIVHLRMSGRLYWHGKDEPSERFLRARAHLDDGSLLDFIDMRRLGGMYVPDPDGTGTPDGLRQIGPEPLEAAFTPAVLRHALRAREATVKGILLDQRTVAGLGNIYVDEALHRAGIHPVRTGASLRRAEIGRLHEAIRAVLEEGIRAQGVSFSLYRDAEGRKGAMGERLLVYGRSGETCYACGDVVARARVAGRGTAYCPRCQPAPRPRTPGGRT